MKTETKPLSKSRSKVVNAAAMAGIYPVDGVWPDIKDSEGFIP